MGQKNWKYQTYFTKAIPVNFCDEPPAVFHMINHHRNHTDVDIAKIGKVSHMVDQHRH